MNNTKIEISDLKSEGRIICPRCRAYHHSLMNPLAIHEVKKDKKVIGQINSPICDQCCRSLLEAFSDPQWSKYFPDITSEEANTIVTSIKLSFKKQSELFSNRGRDE